jgi:hypothetical protein
MVWETRLFWHLFTLCKSGSNFSEVAKFFNQFVKLSHLWALVWPSKPCFIPDLSVLVQSEWNWVLFHETGYQFRRFAGSYFDLSLHLMKNMRGSQGTGKANPKWVVDQFKWETNDTMSNLPKIQPLTVMKPQFGLWSSSLLHWPPTTHPTPSLPWSVSLQSAVESCKTRHTFLKDNLATTSWIMFY